MSLDSLPLLLLSFCLSLGMVLSQCLSLVTYRHPVYTLTHLTKSHFVPSGPKQWLLQGPGVSVSLSLGEALEVSSYHPPPLLDLQEPLPSMTSIPSGGMVPLQTI